MFYISIATGFYGSILNNPVSFWTRKIKTGYFFHVYRYSKIKLFFEYLHFRFLIRLNDA